MHQRVGEFNRRLIDPANQVFRRTSSDSSLQNDICSFVGCIFCARMWREDNGVTSLQADQRFEDSRGGWVSGRNNTTDNADWFCDSDSTKGVIFRKNTTGLFIFIRVIDVFRSEVVLITLSSTIPMPDSATAILARGIRASAAAVAAARKILSTCS